MTNSQLYHHGIKGMKWGVRRSAQQLGHQSPSKESKKSANVTGKESSNKPKKSMGFFKKKEPVKKPEDKEAENIEAKKQKVLASKSAKELYKNSHLFSDSELQSAYNRLNMERNVASLAKNEVSKGEKFVNDAAKWTKSLSDLSNNSITLYNNVARVYNAFSANGQSRPLTRIG